MGPCDNTLLKNYLRLSKPPDFYVVNLLLMVHNNVNFQDYGGWSALMNAAANPDCSR